MPHTDATHNHCSTSGDSTHQLVSAANAQTYALSVTYGDWGKIQQYGLQQTDLTNNVTTSQTRTYSYGSLNEGQTTFAPNSISYADGTNVNEQYGINGSLLRRETTIPNTPPSEELYRFGADGNLRMYSYDRLFYTLYGYDGGTTRTYKYSMDLSPNWVNGRLEAVNFNLHNAMFYPNAYINFNSNGYYTKHYYNGMERIASKLGDQNLPINVNDPELQDRKDQLDSNIRRNVVDITGYEFLPVGEEQNPEDPKPVFELPQVGMTGLQPSADGLYYYHSNHLGSTCYVTDENRSVVQGFLYAPFGEITNEHNVGWQSGTLPKYSFNAKELDEETGMYYYEARYYAPPTFISRDPLFEKYPTISPYTYCANNPVKYIDPTGMEIWEPDRWGNLIAEDGDDAKSLSECMGISYEEACALLTDQGYSTENVPERSVLKLDNAFTRNLAKHGNLNSGHYRLKYNCWGSALTGTQNYNITNRCGINYPVVFDKYLLSNYEAVNASACQLGKTVIRFEYASPYSYETARDEKKLNGLKKAVKNKEVSQTPGDVGSASHGAVYYGKNRNGRVFVYSKNGWEAPPVICPIDVLFGEDVNRYQYGQIRGLNGESGYYNPIKR